MDRQCKIEDIKISTDSNDQDKIASDPQIIKSVIGLLGQIGNKNPIQLSSQDNQTFTTQYEYEIKFNIKVNLKTASQKQQDNSNSNNFNFKRVEIPKPISQMDKRLQNLSDQQKTEILCPKIQKQVQNQIDSNSFKKITIVDPQKVIEKESSQKKKQVQLIYPDMFYLVDKLSQYWSQRSDTSPNAFKKIILRKKFSKYTPELIEVIDYRDRKIQKLPYDFYE